MALTREQFEEGLLEIMPELGVVEGQQIGQGGVPADPNAPGGFTSGLSDISDQVVNIAGQLIPVNSLSRQDQQRLGSLQAQAQDLQPLQAPRLQGSTRIAGNPYSTDISPVTNAIQQGLTRLINARRQRRLLGDPEQAQEIRSQGGPGRSSVVNDIIEQRARGVEGVLPELSRLQTQQATAQSQQQAQQEFIQQAFPEIADRLLQTRQNLLEQEATGQRQQDVEELRQQGRTELEELRQEGRREIQGIIDQRQRDLATAENIAKDEVGSLRDRLATGQITGIGTGIRQQAGRYQSHAEALLRLKGTNLFSPDEYREDHGESIDETIQKLTDKSKQISTLGIRALATDDINELQGIIDQYENELNMFSGNETRSGGGALDDL